MKLRERVSLRIKTIRKRRGLTQAQLAEKVGRTGDAISQLERGLSLPSFETLDRLAEALQVPIRDFFDTDRTDEGSAQRRRLHDARQPDRIGKEIGPVKWPIGNNCVAEKFLFE